MKSFPLSLTVPVLIVCCAAAFYFIGYLPHSQRQAYISQRQLACLNMEPTILKIAQQDDPNGSPASMQITNHYNTTLDKCYIEATDYFMSSPDTNGGQDQNNVDFVYDAVENNMLISRVTITPPFYSKSSGSDDATSYIQNHNGDDISTTTFQTLEHEYMTQ